jgi:hypothetical protein
MHGRNALLAALFPLAALPLVVSSRPAGARPEMPHLRGTYVGGCQSRGGSVWASDLTVFQQSGSMLGGLLCIAAVYPDVYLTGKCSRGGRITLRGKSGSGPGTVQLRLQGRYQPATDQEPAVLSGTYVATGARSDRGSFRLLGGTR